ncbi:hypothetical protein MAR_021136, partial [Mya arenaria]
KAWRQKSIIVEEAAGGDSEGEEETEGKTPALETASMLMYKFYLIRKGLEKEEYHRQEAAGGDSDGEEETEGKTPALEIASMERNKEHFLSFVQCQKSVNDARNLEQSVSMVKSHIEKKLHKLFSQKSTDLKLARVCDCARESDSQQLRQTLPRLQEKISRTNQALDNCTHAQQAADYCLNNNGTAN